MAYQKKTGTIETGARNGKAFKIDGEWYSVFKIGQANGAERGDTVSFEYETVAKGGQEFHNIKGDIKVEGRSQATPAAASRKPEDSPASSGGDSGGVSARDQQIIRQNSLTQANAALATFYGSEAGDQGMAPEDFAQHVVDIARIFEAYSKGEV